MGGCTGKSKKPDNNNDQTRTSQKKNKENSEKQIGSITIPTFTTLEEKIYYLSDKQLTELFQTVQNSHQQKFVEKVITDLKFASNQQINQGVLDLYRKLNHKNETIIRNMGTNGTLCLEIIGKLKTTFDEVHQFIQDNQDFSNQQSQLVENQLQFLQILIITYHIIMTLLDSGISDQKKSWINQYDVNFKKLYDEYALIFQKFGIKNQVQQAQGQTNYYLTGLYDNMLKSLEVSSLKAQDINNTNNNTANKPQQKAEQVKQTEQQNQQNQNYIQYEVEKYLETLQDHCINQAYHSENITDDEEQHQATECKKYSNIICLKKKL